MAGKTEKTPKPATAMPPIDPAKQAECNQQLEQIQKGKDKTREGSWLIVQAYCAILSGKLFEHYQRVVNGKIQRFAAPRQFFSEVVRIDPKTLTRWAACAKAFSHDVFIKEGTTRLSLFLTLAPLIGITNLPADPSEQLLPIPPRKGKPPVQKRFAECSKKNLEDALSAIKGKDAPKLPEAIGIIEAEVTAAYRQAVGPNGPNLLKLREAKDGTIEMALSHWIPLGRAGAEAYIALGKALVAAAEKHPETLEAHGPLPGKDVLKMRDEAVAKTQAWIQSVEADPQARAAVPQNVQADLDNLKQMKAGIVDPGRAAQLNETLAAITAARNRPKT